MRRLWRDEDFISIARKVRHKDDGRIVFVDDAAAILAFGGEDFLKENAARFFKIAAAGAGFGFDGFEDKVGRVNLAMRVRVRDADDIALILKDENVIDFGAAAEINILFLPDREQGFNLCRPKLGECQVMLGAVADDARQALRGPSAI